MEVEPHLTPIDKEQFHLLTEKTSNEARLDIMAKGFWRRRPTAFFDVRVMHVNSASNQNLEMKEIFKRHENEKKRSYLC